MRYLGQVHGVAVVRGRWGPLYEDFLFEDKLKDGPIALTVVSAAGVGGGGTAGGVDKFTRFDYDEVRARDPSVRWRLTIARCGTYSYLSQPIHRGVVPLSLETSTSSTLMESTGFVVLS